MRKNKIMHVCLRLLVVAAVLTGFLFTGPPVAASGTASIDQIRFPAPPDYRVNNSSFRELFWWKITGTTTSTPVEMRHRVIDPDGIKIHDESWDIRGREADVSGAGIFNVENTVGLSVHGDQTQPQYSHNEPLFPAGAKPGVYISTVDYYSAQISGNTNYPVDFPAIFDSESSITFLVRQPLQIFKYHDLNGNGSLDAGEQGLDTWHFSVTGPPGQTWSYTGTVADTPDPTTTSFASNDLTAGFPVSGPDLLVNSAHVGAYTLSGGVFTLSTAMGSAPTAGQTISTVPVATFEGDTSGGGFLDLPNGVLVAGNYTITETPQGGWVNTDPGLPGDPNPYQKTITVPGELQSLGDTVVFGNMLPGLDVTKTADPLVSKVGDQIEYTVTVNNTGDGDLTKQSVTDTLLGDLTVSFNATLPYQTSETHTFQYTVQQGDPDPLPNTVTAIYDSTGFDNNLTVTANATVDLVQPGIDINKTANTAVSKVGDTVHFTVTANNTGTSDLILDSFTDTLKGDIASQFGGVGSTLAIGAFQTYGYDYVVPVGAPDPLVNMAVAHYHPTGLTNNITDNATVSVDLVQPGIDINKTANTAVSKVGDTVHFTVTANNTGTSDLILDSFTDTLKGDIASQFGGVGSTLAIGAFQTYGYDYVVPVGAPDPLVNMAVAHYHPTGLTNNITDNATVSVDLVQPGIDINKTANTAVSKVGDTVHFTVTANNTGTSDLILDSFTDTLKGDIASQFGGVGSTLAIGAFQSYGYDYVVPLGAPDPLVNMAVAHYHPTGLTNNITDNATVSVDLVQPGIDINKTANTAVSKVGDTVHFTVTANNTGTSDLILDSFTDTLKGDIASQFGGVGSTLAIGAFQSYGYDYVVPVGAPDPLVNMAVAHYHPTGLTNNITDNATVSVDLVQPGIDINKTANTAVSKVGDTVHFTVTANNTGTSDLILDSFTDTLKGDIASQFGGVGSTLAIGAFQTYGYDYVVPVGAPDPLVNMAVAHYHPTGLTNNITDNATVSVDLVQPGIDINKTANTAVSKVGDTVHFTVTANNTGTSDLILDSFTDTLKGDIASQFGGVGSTLAIGAFQTYGYDYVVPVGAPDPLVNMAVAHYHPTGLTNNITDNATVSVDLVQPGIDINKTANTAVSKVGDTVHFTVTANNTGTSDLILDSFTDTLKGDIASQFGGVGSTLAIGAFQTYGYDYVVPVGAPDPLVNMAVAHYHPTGLTNNITDNATVSVDLVQPGIDINKTANTAVSKVGDTVHFTVTANNTGTSDLILDSFTDTLKGDIASQFGGVGSTLAIGAFQTYGYDYVVPVGAPDPLVNMAVAHYHPTGLTNNITDNATVSVDLVQPGIDINKTANTAVSKVGDTVHFTVTANNTGTSDLILDSFTDTLKGDIASQFGGVGSTLAIGAFQTYGYDYVVPVGAPDPLVNMAVAHYHPTGLTNNITDNATVSVDLVQPGIDINKTANTAVSKVGDTVHFTVTANNTGTSDLILDSFTDTLKGDIASQFGGVGSTLAIGAFQTYGYDYVVPVGAPDPLVNMAVAHYHPTGLTNNITDNATVSVDLVQPGIDINKTANTAVSKVGDTVHFTVTANNTGTSDLILDSFTDTLKGDIASHFGGVGSTLAIGAFQSYGYDYVVPVGAPDPLVNMAVAHYHPTGLTNNITDNATVSVDLVQPGIDINKTANTAVSKVGDTVHFTVTANNTGTSDLILDSFTDTLKGDIASQFGGVGSTLAIGAFQTYGYDYVVPVGAPDPLVNMAVAHYHPTGLTNNITDNATVSVDLVQPGIDINKTANTAVSKVGDTVHFTVTANNTGTSDLILDSFTDTLKGDIASHFGGVGSTLAIGAFQSYGYDYVVPVGAPDPLVNMAVAHYHPTGGLTNNITDNATFNVDLVHPTIDITKTVDPSVSLVGGMVTYTITVTNTSLDVTLVNIVVTDTLLGGPLSGFADHLDPGDSSSQQFSYTILDTDPDPLINTATVHANPAGGLTNDITDEDQAEVDIIHPNTEVILNINHDKVIAGAPVNFVITEQNKGDAQLTNIFVDLIGMNDANTQQLFTEHLTDLSPTFVLGSDAGGDGKLDPGEMWQWNVTLNINEKTNFTATGHAFDGFDDITAPTYPDEQKTGTVDIRILIPASSDLSIGLMIAALGGAIVFLMVRRTRRSTPLG